MITVPDNPVFENLSVKINKAIKKAASFATGAEIKEAILKEALMSEDTAVYVEGMDELGFRSFTVTGEVIYDFVDTASHEFYTPERFCESTGKLMYYNGPQRVTIHCDFFHNTLTLGQLCMLGSKERSLLEFFKGKELVFERTEQMRPGHFIAKRTYTEQDNKVAKAFGRGGSNGST